MLNYKPIHTPNSASSSVPASLVRRPRLLVWLKMALAANTDDRILFNKIYLATCDKIMMQSYFNSSDDVQANVAQRENTIPYCRTTLGGLRHDVGLFFREWTKASGNSITRQRPRLRWYNLTFSRWQLQFQFNDVIFLSLFYLEV